MNESISHYFIDYIKDYIIIIALTACMCSIFNYAVRKIYFKLQNLYIKKIR